VTLFQNGALRRIFGARFAAASGWRKNAPWKYIALHYGMRVI
jgi:hypothetical protein